MDGKANRVPPGDGMTKCPEAAKFPSTLSRPSAFALMLWGERNPETTTIPDPRQIALELENAHE
jgi:hypothetical protein